jgi:hypothetical protein
MRNSGRWVLAAAVVALCWPGTASAQVSLTNAGYNENYDSMGTAGTAPPAGWAHFTVAGGSGTWSAATGVDPALLATVPVSTVSTTLSATLDPNATNNNNGFNAANAGTDTNRSLSTSPTGVAGAVLQLQLTNNTGRAVNSLRVGYDIRRFGGGAGGQDELPGYWLFYSLDNGTTWNEVAAVRPGDTGSGAPVIVPNDSNTTTVPQTTFNLASSVANGGSIVLRWVDDNGGPSSPDRINGLDLFSITAPAAVPEPSSLICVSAVALLGGVRFVRKRFRRAV